MNFDPNALLNFLPQFVIGGALALYFYVSFRKYKPELIKDLSFITPQGNNSNDNTESSSDESSALDSIVSSSLEDPPEVEEDEVDYSGYSTPVDIEETMRQYERSSFIGDTQLIVLTINVWILVSLLLSSVKTVNVLLPTLPGIIHLIVLVALGASIAIAIMTTVISRVSLSKRFMAIYVAAAGGITFGTFYAPSMEWVGNLRGLIHLTVVYSAVIMACLAAYSLASYMNRKTALSASTYSSFTSYGITVFILLYNFITAVF